MDALTGFLYTGYVIACGELTAAIAKSKGRDGEWWFAFGTLFGLIGLTIVMIVRQSRRPHGG